MKNLKFLFLVLLVSIFIGCGHSSSSSKDTVQKSEAKYKVIFKGNWTAITFAKNFPSNAHFSPIVGVSHDSSTRIFKVGDKATAGVIEVAQTGKTDIILNEISALISDGSADIKILTEVISSGNKELAFTISVNSSHPYISVVTMLAPSPDWFIGINSLNLLENGKWLNSKSINLKVYDAGSDSGLKFTSSDLSTNPKENITTLTTNSVDADFKEGVHKDDSNRFIASINIIKIN